MGDFPKFGHVCVLIHLLLVQRLVENYVTIVYFVIKAPNVENRITIKSGYWAPQI